MCFLKSSLIARLKPSAVITETVISEKANCHLVMPSFSKMTKARASKEEIKHPYAPAVQGRTPFNGRIVPCKHTGLYYWSGNSMNLLNLNRYPDSVPGSKVKEKIKNQALRISSCVQNTWKKAMDLVK